MDILVGSTVSFIGFYLVNKLLQRGDKEEAKHKHNSKLINDVNCEDCSIVELVVCHDKYKKIKLKQMCILFLILSQF